MKPSIAEANIVEHKRNKLQQWHEKLGHISLSTMLVKDNPTVRICKEDLQFLNARHVFSERLNASRSKFERKNSMNRESSFIRMYVDLFLRQRLTGLNTILYSKMIQVSTDSIRSIKQGRCL